MAPRLDDRVFYPAQRPGINPARLVPVTAPAELFASTDQVVQDALRLDSDVDATYVNLVLAAARRHFERVTGLALLTQEWRAEFDRVPFGTALELPRAPLLADGNGLVISLVTYLDDAGAAQTMDAADYVQPTAGLGDAFGRLALALDGTWPSVGALPAALRVTFTAGFGAAADVPEDIKAAVLFIAAWWYENRVPAAVGNIVNALPQHLNDLIESHRVAFIA